MLLIQDGAMALDDPVGRWLPELAEPRVLRSLASELDDRRQRHRLAPSTGLTGILLTQRMVTSPEPTELAKDFWAAAYASIDA